MSLPSALLEQLSVVLKNPCFGLHELEFESPCHHSLVLVLGAMLETLLSLSFLSCAIGRIVPVIQELCGD